MLLPEHFEENAREDSNVFLFRRRLKRVAREERQNDSLQFDLRRHFIPVTETMPGSPIALDVDTATPEVILETGEDLTILRLEFHGETHVNFRPPPLRVVETDGKTPFAIDETDDVRW